MLSALVLAALLTARQAPAPPRPAWVERLPEQQGRLYALGTADLGAEEGQAITRASDRARLEVVARLRATVKGQTSVTTRTSESQQDGQKGVGEGQRVVRDEVSVGAKAEDVPGLVVEQTFTDPAARTVYALAYLDLGQARATLGKETSRKALWKLRRLTLDLDRLEASIGLLALTGTGTELRAALQTERAALEQRLDQLTLANLPPVDFSKAAMAVRSNVDLPPGVAGYLKAQVAACGLVARDLNPDLVLDLVFSGGDKGPEFIYTSMDLYSGITYRLEAKLTLTEGGGLALTRTVPILIVQGDTPEGMVSQFRKQIERWLPRLLGEFKAEMQ